MTARELSRPALSLLLSAALFVVLAACLLQLPWDGAQSLQQAVAAQSNHAGVSHPVTAVLLNFRSWDTLLELGVLMLALLGVRTLPPSPPLSPGMPPGPVLLALTRQLVPLMVLVAGYLLWRGSHAPGGAFHAGAVLGAAGVLLVLSGRGLPPAGEALMRLILVAGIAVFLLVGAVLLAAGDGLLTYPPQAAYSLILLIEAAASISIGATLAMLYARGQAEERAP